MSKKNIKFSKWFKRQFCDSCSQELNYLQIMESSGCCPLCGVITRGTIVSVKDISSRIKRTSWWNTKFPFYHVKKELESK